MEEKVMKNLWKTLIIVAVIGLAGTVYAQNVTIVYPINEGTYPITDPGPGKLGSAYFTASFSVTCSGGSHVVKWGFDNDEIGSAKFYDQISEQQVWKLPGGTHVFWVDAGKCGGEKIKFNIGQ